MHVITGRFKGMPLATPRAETRPTTDRTKEALFSRLEAHGLLRDARVLDLFGGTGALGIEALSRGARELVTVESSAQAAQRIAQTLTALRRHAGWEKGMSARVVHAKAERYAAKAKPGEPFDLVLIDPPYAFAPPAAPEGWVMADRRDYGETAVYTFRSQEYEQIVQEQSGE